MQTKVSTAFKYLKTQMMTKILRHKFRPNGQFFQALHDNLCQHFPCTDILGAARVLCKESWPENPLQRALYGEQDVALLCKIFQFDNALSAEIVLEYSLYKRKSCLGANLKRLVKLLEVLPVTSADSERGFSQMNLCHNESRNRLSTSTVSDLLVIGMPQNTSCPG